MFGGSESVYASVKKYRSSLCIVVLVGATWCSSLLYWAHGNGNLSVVARSDRLGDGMAVYRVYFVNSPLDLAVG